MGKMKIHKREVGIGKLRPEYRFDYRKAKPNRFAGQPIEDRAKRAKKGDFRRILAKVPSRKPLSGDEL